MWCWHNTDGFLSDIPPKEDKFGEPDGHGVCTATEETFKDEEAALIANGYSGLSEDCPIYQGMVKPPWECDIPVRIWGEDMKNLIDALRDPTHPLHQKVLTQIEEALQQRAQEIFNEIEAVSEVIDWEDDLGKMRELKEETYQSIKAKFTKPKGWYSYQNVR
jgi:hypothetical protein